jgi:hypothetical protein
MSRLVGTWGPRSDDALHTLTCLAKVGGIPTLPKDMAEREKGTGNRGFLPGV